MGRPLDRIDCDIIRELQKNARISNKRLSEAVHLAPSSCLERVRRLQAEGVLRGFRAELDPSALGIGLQAMIAVQLVSHTREDVRSFHDYVMTVPEVVAMYHVTGEKDFLVHVAVRDADHLRDMAMDAFTIRPEVSRLETSLIYERLARPGLPILVEPEG